MKTLNTFLATLALVLSLGLSAQDSAAQVDKLSTIFQFDDAQRTEIIAVYDAHSADLDVVMDKIKEQRQRSQEGFSSPQDRDFWRSNLEDLINERKSIIASRDSEMLSKMTKEQQASWKEWKSGNTPEALRKKASN